MAARQVAWAALGGSFGACVGAAVSSRRRRAPPPMHNVGEYVHDGARRGQVTAMNAATGITCRHLLGLDPGEVGDIVAVPHTAHVAATVPLRATVAPQPSVGDPMTVVWEDGGFHTAIDTRVSRADRDDPHAFAVSLGLVDQQRTPGISGAMVWDGAAVAGVVTGTQQANGTTHAWVEMLRRSSE